MKKYAIWLLPMMLVAFIILGLYSQTRSKANRLYVRYYKTSGYQNKDTINTKANRIDTSEWKDLYYSEYVDFVMAAYNTDSGRFYVNIDGEFAGYQTEIFNDSLIFNTSTTFTLNDLPYYAKALKSPAAINYPGLERIRVRTTILPYTNGASDTNAYFKQYIIRR